MHKKMKTKKQIENLGKHIFLNGNLIKGPTFERLSSCSAPAKYCTLAKKQGRNLQKRQCEEDEESNS
jgi:hypothetical protein